MKEECFSWGETQTQNKARKRQYCIYKGCPSRLSNVTSVAEHQEYTASDVNNQRGENSIFERNSMRKFNQEYYCTMFPSGSN